MCVLHLGTRGTKAFSYFADGTDSERLGAVPLLLLPSLASALLPLKVVWFNVTVL